MGSLARDLLLDPGCDISVPWIGPVGRQGPVAIDLSSDVGEEGRKPCRLGPRSREGYSDEDEGA